MSPLCNNNDVDAHADDVLFTSILDKNLSEFARSDAMKSSRSLSLQKALAESEPKRSCNRRRRRVSFGSVQTREYSRTIGDNPACRDGPPLGLGWEYSDDTCEEISVDAHQLKRVWRQSIEGQYLFPMSVTERRNLLKWEWSVPKEEMKAAEKEASRIRLQRRETNTMNPIVQKARVIRKRFLSTIQPRRQEEQ
mmetsp:Transcript_2310/g.6733  ORF Transcript_2310/g.6733 Transcript_2310/m.6733 type:complete len:194 (+) Transcript_2310:51-632(+)